jgi:hypothetical protein
MKNTQTSNLYFLSYSRIANMLSELVPTVKTFGILTESNPLQGVLKIPTDKQSWFNNKQNKDLEHTLRQGGYGFIPLKGHYGEVEKSYFVPNITKAHLQHLGTIYQQESVVFGELQTSEKRGNGSYPFKAEMIKTYPDIAKNEQKNVIGKVMGLVEGFINAEGETNFTERQGRKFNLDFLFDSMPEVWEAEHGALKITNNMSAEFITKVNQKSDHACTSTGMYGWICRKSVQANLYKFEGKELLNRKIAEVKVTRPDKPFANLEKF